MKLKIYCCLIFLLFIQFLWSVFSTYYYCHKELVQVVKNGDELLQWDPDIAKWRNSPEFIYMADILNMILSINLFKMSLLILVEELPRMILYQ